MKKYISSVFAIAAFSVASYASAQELSENAQNQVPEVSTQAESVLNTSEQTETVAPADVPQSYLIPEDPVDTAPLSTAENALPEEAPDVEAQVQTESNEPDNTLQAAEDVPQESTPEQSDAPADSEPQTGWRSGLSPYAGVGPAFDLRDDATGYSARIGLDVHWNYIGIGLDVTWNMIWAANGAKRSDHNNVAYRTTNSGLLAMLNGYIPLTDHFIVKLGAGVGLGKRYEITFSDIQDEKFNSEDTSWLARLQAGMFWLFDTNFTLGLDMEFNFGGYTDPHEVWWSDKEDDISLGLVLTVSYQYMN